MVYIQETSLSLGPELGQGEFGSVLRGTYRMPDGKSVRGRERERNRDMYMYIYMHMYYVYVLYVLCVCVWVLLGG